MSILRIKEIMTTKGISRDDLASGTGVSPTTISNISSEKNMPTIQLLLKIAEVLDVDVRELFVSTKGTAVTQQEVEEAKELLSKSITILSGHK